jgi:type VI secretion system secreted protein VgrG
VTPSGDAVFSPLTFATGYDAAYNPLGASEQFTNPVGHLYALFSYDQMINGVQWTALWYRDGELVYFETLEWDGGTGGYGFSDWNPEPEEWLPGFYQVVIFVGLDAKISGDFEVVGLPATVTPTPTITHTPTITLTTTPTHTRWPTNTPAP